MRPRDEGMMRFDFGETVGSTDFVFLFLDGSKKPVQLRVGKPYKIADGDWACPCELVGFERRHPDMRGADSMQALCLAISLLRRRLEDFVDKGGKILDADDESEWSLREAMAMFGDVGLSRNGDAA
jgi:uncharacterized protein DUF6968